MLVEGLVMLLVDVLLLSAAWWCWRRPLRGAMSHWLRLQAFPLVAFVIMGLAAFVDRQNQYSSALGQVFGLALVPYFLFTALLAVQRSRARGKTG